MHDLHNAHVEAFWDHLEALYLEPELWDQHISAASSGDWEDIPF